MCRLLEPRSATMERNGSRVNIMNMFRTCGLDGKDFQPLTDYSGVVQPSLITSVYYVAIVKANIV